MKTFSYGGQAPGPAGTLPQELGKSFEETYPSYPFSILVGLSLALGLWLGGVLRKCDDRPLVEPRGEPPCEPGGLFGPLAGSGP